MLRSKQASLLALRLALLLSMIGTVSAQANCLMTALNSQYIVGMTQREARYLCRGVVNSVQPVLCFGQAVSSQGLSLSWRDSLQLCRGTWKAAQTIDCVFDAISWNGLRLPIDEAID